MRATKFHITVLLFVVLLACGEKKEETRASLMHVVVSPVEKRDLGGTSEWVSTLDGVVNAEIRAKVSGYLISVKHREGASVKEGDLLFEIESDQYQAALGKAQGDLEEARAKLEKWSVEVARLAPLVKTRAVSEREYDVMVQNRNGAQGAVGASEAAVRSAQLNLDYTKVRSPVTGIVGVSNAHVGDLVGPSASSLLTTVSQIDPMRALFPISEQEYLKFSSKISISATKDEKDRARVFELILSDGSVYPEKGWFMGVDRAVNVGTGTIQAIAYFPNPQLMLRPGIYAKVRMPLEVEKGMLVVPARAIHETQGTHQVAVVDGNNTAQIRRVTPGTTFGNLRVLKEGVSEGERVVIDGFEKIRGGEQVEVTVKPLDATQSSSAPV